jgi:hypothetical protein
VPSLAFGMWLHLRTVTDQWLFFSVKLELQGTKTLAILISCTKAEQCMYSGSKIPSENTIFWLRSSLHILSVSSIRSPWGSRFSVGEVHFSCPEVQFYFLTGKFSFCPQIRIRCLYQGWNYRKTYHARIFNFLCETITTLKENTSQTPNTSMLRKSGRNQCEPSYLCQCCLFLWKSLYILEIH